MTTTNQYLRASLLLAGGALLGGALIGGCAGEAEGPDALDDVDFATRSEDVTSNPLTPVLNCMDDLGRNMYKAHFGYTNSSSRSVRVPIGANNFFVPLPKNQGQPTDFAAGNHPDVFQVNFSTRDGWDRLAWWLNGKRALATRHTPICKPPPPPQCTTNADCDDEDLCTNNTCDSGKCKSTPAASGTACAHGNICDGTGKCVQCVSGAQCDDERSCTTDACTANVCTHGNAPAGTLCGHTGQVCNATGQCITGSGSCLADADCDDEDLCTQDACDTGSGTCSHSFAPAGTECAHGNVCNATGQCVQCVSAANCNDELTCTTDSCVANLCTHGPAPVGTPCGHTGQACNASGVCTTP